MPRRFRRDPYHDYQPPGGIFQHKSECSSRNNDLYSPGDSPPLRAVTSGSAGYRPFDQQYGTFQDVIAVTVVAVAND
jgi:hypothetical protein